MANELIISDTGPLLALSITKNLFLITKLFREIIITEIVYQELEINSLREGADNLKRLYDEKIIKVYSKKINVPPELYELLDPGELSSIYLAEKLKVPLLIDEKKGRIYARKIGLKITGLIGIILLAKEKRIITKVMPVLNDIKNTGYFISDDLMRYAKNKSKE